MPARVEFWRRRRRRRRVNIHTLMPTLESMSIKMIYVCHVMCPDVRARAKLVESVMESRNP